MNPTFSPWHDFYALLGQASATMIGLLFVAASVGSGVFSQNARGGLRMFLSASVVHFSAALASCLVIFVPFPRWEFLGGFIFLFGAFGLAYSGLAWRDIVRDGLSVRIDLEDRFWYAVLPAIAYAAEAAAGLGLCLHHPFACTILAAATSALLLIGIHNAWDITLWSVTRPRDHAPEKADAAHEIRAQQKPGVPPVDPAGR